MRMKHRLRTGDTKKNPIAAMFLALFAMYVVSGILLLLLALVLYQLEPAESVIRAGIVAIYVITGLFGGVLLGKMRREKKFFWGLAVGLLYFVILFVVSAAVKGGFDMEPTRVFTALILCGASGMAGGMLG